MTPKTLSSLTVALVAGSLAVPSCANAAVTFFGGHGYEFFATGLSWQDAKSAAAAASPLAGYNAHLVTITSAGEDAYVKTLTSSAVYVWAAGTDQGLEGTWKWDAGPEAGQTFYVLGAVVQPGYSNWNAGEPNNSGTENFLHLNANTPNNWNDIYPTFQSGGYVVEYSPTGAVPEPASWALLIGGFGIAGVAMRRRRGLSVRYA